MQGVDHQQNNVFRYLFVIGEGGHSQRFIRATLDEVLGQMSPVFD